MSLRCEPCDVVFNGIKPYEAHMASIKHMKKVGADTIRINLTQLDKFVKEYKNEYRCIACCLTLNSLQQAQLHVSGKKHKKEVGNKVGTDFISPANITPASLKFSSEIQNRNTSTESAFLQNLTRDSEYSFIFRDIKIKDVMADVKVFGVDDPLVF